MTKYYVNMTRMIESIAVLEVEAASEDEAIDKAEAIFLSDIDDTKIEWTENGIEGINFDVETKPALKLL